MKELPLDTLSTPIHLQVVSHTPDRIRLRLPDHYQAQQVITQIASSLKVFFPQIEKVKTNFHTGSITVYYCDENGSFEEVLSKLQGLGIILTHAPVKKLQPAPKLTQPLASLNQQITEATKDTVDLRLLLSYAVVAIALRSAMFQIIT